LKQLSHRLLQLVDTAHPVLSQVEDHASTEPIRTGGWSRKQLLGHLIDSASNNHQRFVRASLQPVLNFPGYDQNGSISSPPTGSSSSLSGPPTTASSPT
jgi:hypothetical protein